MGVTGVQAAVFIANARGDSTNTFGGRLDDAKKTSISDDQVLNSFNQGATFRGKPTYKTVDELKKALKEQGRSFEAERNKINRMTGGV